MRVRRLTGCLLFVLSILWASGAYAEMSQTVGDDDGPATHSADIALGTATLDHLEVGVGPFGAAVGLFNRLHIGSYTLPWLAAALAPGSIAPNGFAKVDLGEYGKITASLSASLFYARLGDVDGDGLKLRALIVPVRAQAGLDWNPQLSTTFELGSVYSTITGEHVSEGATDVYGVAVAHSVHAGLTQRLQVSERFAAWGRIRSLVGHAPVTASVESQISEDLDVRVDARGDASEISSGFSGAFGVHLGSTRFSLTAGAGYGTWFLPGLYIPVGQNLPFAEFNFYVRF